MRIAIPVANDLLADQFSDAISFAFYDVHDDTRAVTYRGRQGVPAGTAVATFLRGYGIEVVMAHAITQEAVNLLLEEGILAIKDAPVLAPDALVAHLVSGTLMATPPEAAMHGCGGGGGCGHCCGGHGHGAGEGAEACGSQACAEHPRTDAIQSN